MAYYSGFNPKYIENFTKITNLNNIKPGENYLIRYATIGKPRLFHIAKFREIGEENGEPVYWFDSLYIKRPSASIWEKTLEHRPHISFDNGELYINEGFINRDHEPYSIYIDNYDFAIFGLGKYGNQISENVRPEEILSNVMSHSMRSVKKTTPKHQTVRRTHGGKKNKKFNKSMNKRIF